MKILFVGERRSPTAKRMKVRWEDGRLAAKQLFDAFEACGFDREAAQFTNLFERGGAAAVEAHLGQGGQIVAMGRQVQRELESWGWKPGLDFVPLVHPAARGAVRRKSAYAAAVKVALTAVRAWDR